MTDFDSRLATLQHLNDFFSYPANTGRDPESECVLINVGVLFWIVREVVRDA